MKEFLGTIAASLAMMIAALGPAAAQTPATPPHRLIVLTDIEADPDDTQSLVRLLLYANEIDIEALIATTSTHMRTRVNPSSIHAIIAAYGQVQDNLLLHAPGFPEQQELDALVTQGLPLYGMQGVGAGKDSPGSERIIRALEADDPRPVWVSVWGGANTLAQALYTLRETRAPAELERLLSKLRVYTISDQDDSGPWIRREFPGVFYIVSPGDAYGQATWNAIMRVVDGADNTTISNSWLAENIQQSHGPLGAIYPDVVWGMEGDTPAFLSLIPNGLNAPEQPHWGGWGGRYELYTPEGDTILNRENLGPESRPIWTNTDDAYAPPVASEYGRATRNAEPRYNDFLATLWRWRDDFQNDFAARMDWTILPPSETNHAPIVVLEGPARLTVRAGQGFGLSARPSSDPDRDSLSFHWFYYPEPGTYEGEFNLGAENSDMLWGTAPQVTQTQTAHIILRVSDKGEPELASYARIIVTIEP